MILDWIFYRGKKSKGIIGSVDPIVIYKVD